MTCEEFNTNEAKQDFANACTFRDLIKVIPPIDAAPLTYEDLTTRQLRIIMCNISKF